MPLTTITPPQHAQLGMRIVFPEAKSAFLRRPRQLFNFQSADFERQAPEHVLKCGIFEETSA